MSPRVTVVTIFYNRTVGLDPSMECLRDQDYRDMKVLAIDDGSTDDTFERLSKFQGGRVEVRTQPNCGFTPTLAAALEQIDSEFIAVHGSGDVSDVRRIRLQVEALDANPGCVMAAALHESIDPVTGKTLGTRRAAGDAIFARKDIETTTPFTHGTVVYRTSVYRQAGGYEPLFKFCGDWDLWFRMMKLGNTIMLGEALYKRVAQPDGASFHPKKSIEQIKFKRLALKLSRLDDVQRAEVLRVLATTGLDAAVESENRQIISDIARRQAKLTLMGWLAEAEELHDIAAGQGLDAYPLPYKLALTAAPWVSRLGMPPHLSIKSARRLFLRRRFR